MEKLSKNPIKFGFEAAKIHKKWSATALIIVVIATTLDRFSVVVLKNFTDSLNNLQVDIDSIWFWAIVYPLLYLVTHVFWRLSGFTGMRWFMNMRSTTYQALYEYLTLHSKDYFNNRFAGALSNKITNAVDGAEHLFESGLWQFVPLTLGLMWYIIFSFQSDYRLGLIILFWSAIFVLVNIYFARLLQPFSFDFATSLSNLKGRVVDSLSNISIVQEYAHISEERKYIRNFVDKQYKTGLLHWTVSEWVLVINGLLIFLFIFLMIGTSVFLFQHNIISIGVVIMSTAIVVDLSRQFLFLGQEMKNIARYYGETREGLEEILSEHLILDTDHAKALKLTDSQIDIEEIDFDYENSNVFTNFSLSIKKGEKIGLVGKSGAGKTTFVSLLLRHYDVKNGVIKIDGQDISKVTLESLRSAIAFVPQDTTLFHRSIKENISYSNPGATDQEIRRAANQAQAHDFIESLPKKYQTLVGERGVRLSGGQRQRIAIARAFLKNAPILILDEATSSLDSQSEQLIQDSLEKLMKGRTVIAIAHRLSTLKEMDRIIVIENGKIVEDGNPEELLKRKNGKFKIMWDHQVKGFIVDE